MLGKNPIRGLVKNNGETLYVQEIFPTIQGEGCFVGYPSVFIRLGGCNLACEFCDTEFESFKEVSLEQIMRQIYEFKGNNKTNLIVITGGEPLRQPIEKLCKTLLDNGFMIQIETNGTINRHLPEEVNIVCSPKASKNGYYKINSDFLQCVKAIKFLISKHIKYYDSVPEIGQNGLSVPIYLQPMDELNEQKNHDNTMYAIDLCHKTGHILSLQTHKFINIK